MSYLYTGSSNGSNISTGLSTQVVIEVNNSIVGAIQRFVPRQNRPIRGVPEVGTDGFIEKVPHAPTDITIDVERIVFDRLSLPAAFARQFVNIAAQRVPFNILVHDKANVSAPLDDGDISADASGLITHQYTNCWFQSLQTTFQAGDYIISESAQIHCEFIRSFTNPNGPVINPNGGSGARHVNVDTAGTNIESLADQGRRGSLDAAGLAFLLLP